MRKISGYGGRRQFPGRVRLSGKKNDIFDPRRAQNHRSHNALPVETDIGRWLRGKCKKKTEQLWKKSKCNKLIVNDNDNDNNSYFVLLQKILRQKGNKFTLHTSLFILLLINMKLFGKINSWKAKTSVPRKESVFFQIFPAITFSRKSVRLLHWEMIKKNCTPDSGS